MNLAGKHVLVLGLGESGLAAALWCAQRGATLRVADTREFPERLSALRKMVPQLAFVGGKAALSSVPTPEVQLSPHLLIGIDIVVVSPGLSPRKELALICAALAERNIPLWSEIELFAQALADLREMRGYRPKVLAITGTNGKTTVTSLTGKLCEAAGWRAQVAGNISPTALDVLRLALLQDNLPEVWVLELSSFQLHGTYSLQADAATILNITQDHLDWHGDMATYVADKMRIFGEKTQRIVNRAEASKVSERIDATSEGVSRISFGSDAPPLPGCFGLVNDDKGLPWLATMDEEHHCVRLMPTADLKIHGQHNAMNTLAALALCRAIDCPWEPMLAGLRQYEGEPHRVTPIATINHVDYYDDSKGTNVGATVAAILGLGQAFGQASRRLVMILGGDGKGQDFSPLRAPLVQYARACVLIGRDGPQINAVIGDALSAANIPLMMSPDLSQAVHVASAMAQPGDAVVLSPACSSLDQFRNYVHRADVFCDAVRKLALTAHSLRKAAV